MKKSINLLYKIMLIFIIFCFSVSLIGAVFFYVNRSNDYLNPLVLIIGSIIYLLLLIKLYKFIIKQSDKNKKIIVIVLLILQFLLLFLSSQIISSVPKVDLIHILTEINNLNENHRILNYNYFSVYPNNRFLVILLYAIQIITINSHIIFGMFSSLCITVMSLFTYKTVNKVFNINKAILSLFICVLSPIFYLYVSYYYTDILLLPLASILIYLIVKNEKDTNKKSNIINGILIGIVSVIAYKIRAVGIFILIAYIIYLFITKKLIYIVKKIIPIFISLLVTFLLLNGLDKAFFTHIDEDKAFPMTHWVMMGVNVEKHGYYNHDDYKLTYSKPKDEKISTNIEVIKQRLNKAGIFGISKLMVSKLVTVWGKGDYSYQKYLDLVEDYNISYRYIMEDKNIVINYLLQFSKIVILILSILSLIKLYKTQKISVIAIALFGAIIFYLIWEVCPRYGLSFLPWLILLSSYSYDSLNINLNKFKFYKYSKYILIVSTLILFIVGFNKYTSSSLKENLVSKSTSNKTRLISLNKDTTIIQGLKLNSKFNEIKIQFKKNDNNNSIYKLELLDDKENTIYKLEFSESDIKDKKYTTFKLDKNYKKGNYYIKLTTNSDSNIEAYISYKKQYDYYKQGILEVNGKEEEGDLMFEVLNKENRGIFTYFEYISIFILTIVVEYIVMFRKKEEVNE